MSQPTDQWNPTPKECLQTDKVFCDAHRKLVMDDIFIASINGALLQYQRTRPSSFASLNDAAALGIGMVAINEFISILKRLSEPPAQLSKQPIRDNLNQQ